MSKEVTATDFGEPDLKVGSLQLWVHGRQCPDSEEYYDVNWLRVTAHCGALGASVWATGAILMTADIARLGDECEGMLSGERKLATLDPLEPYLKISLERADDIGHIWGEVKITPDHLTQTHQFEFEVDQSYLPGIIQDCASILRKYPIRGLKDRRK